MKSDTGRRIGDIDIALPAAPMCHVVAGLHMGPMGRVRGVDAVLTLAQQPGHVGDGIQHLHMPLSYQEFDHDALEKAVTWTQAHFHGNRTVLVRSEKGLQRPALVIGMVILRLGGQFHDALQCLQRAHYGALTDFRYRAVLRQEWELLNRPIR